MQQTINIKILADNKQAMGAAKELNKEVDKVSAPRMLTAAKNALNKATGGVAGPAGDSSMARGVMGSTKAEGRDFAKQAQGLGGLVHIYATFAANIFAVSAAFGALSRAADTTNMVKGLDQLGASSGKALGTLAKQLMATTDGAISLRDSMTSVAQASSAGMANAAILRMGTVAKQASQALGVAMPDAMSRITRGIAKLEPELLDEIGIMVRLDKSSQDYARTLGKSASALTDFERRQGFANAVLDQAEKKFGAIQIDANPYAKLQASLENAMHTGLELVNKVLTPIANILSSNPIALAGAMALVAATLLRQAVPAIGMIKERMAEIAKAATDAAVARATEARKSYTDEYNRLKQSELAKSALLKKTAIDNATTQYKLAEKAADDVANQAVAKFDAAEAKLKSLKAKSGSLASKLTDKLFTDPGSVTDAEIAKLEQVAKAQETNAAKGVKGALESANAQREHANAIREVRDTHLDYFAKEEAAKAKRLDTINKAAEADARVSAQYEVNADKVVKEQLKSKGVMDAANQNQMIADRMLRSSAVQNIASVAAQTGATLGFMSAMKEAHNEIKAMKTGTKEMGGQVVGAFTAANTAGSYFKSTIAAATGAVGRFLNFAGPWAMFAGIVIAVGSAFDDWASEATKEAGLFSTATESAAGSIKLLSEVSAKLWLGNPEEWLSAESMQARANAVDGLTKSLEEQAKAFKAWENKAGVWDSFWDKIGTSRSTKLSSSIAEGIAAAIANTPTTSLKTEYEDKIRSILKLDRSVTLDKGTLSKKVNEDNRAQLIDLEVKYSKAINDSAEKAGMASKAFANLNKVYGEMNQSLTSFTGITKLGISMLEVSKSINISFQDINGGFAELVRLVNAPEDLASFGDVGADLLRIKPEIEKISDAYAFQEKAVHSLRIEQAQLLKDNKYSSMMGVENPNYKKTTYGSFGEEKIDYRNTIYVKKHDERLAEIDRILNEKLIEIEDATKVKEAYLKSFSEKNVEYIRSALKNVQDGFGIALAQASLKFQNVIAGFLPGAVGIQEQARIALEEVDIRLKANKLMADANVARVRNTLAIEKLSLMLNGEAISGQIKAGGGNTRKLIEQGEANDRSLRVNANKMDLVSGKKDAFSSYSAALQSNDAELREAAESVGSTMLHLSQQNVEEAAARYEKLGITVSAAVKTLMLEATEATQKAESEIARLDKKIKNTESLVAGSSTMALVDQAESETAVKQQAQLNLLLKQENDIIAKYNLLTKDADPKQRDMLDEGIYKDIKELDKKKVVLLETFAEENKAAKLRRISQEYSIKNALEVYNVKKAEVELASREQSLSVDKQRLELLKTMGALSDSSVLDEQLLLDKKSALLATETRIKQIKDAQESETSTVEQKYAVDVEGLKDVDLNSVIKAANELYTARELTLGRINGLAQDNLNLTNTKLANDLQALEALNSYNKLMADQAANMKLMVESTESLSVLFGEMGDNIGKAGEALLKMAQDDTNYTNIKLALNEKLAESMSYGDEEGTAKIKADIIKLDKKKASQELANIASVAGATKKLFKEEQAGYKIISGLEKAAHFAKLYNDNQELISTVVTLGKAAAIELGLMSTTLTAEQAKDQASAVSKIPKVIMEFMSWLGPWGTAAAGVAIAAVLGSGPGGASSGPSIEDSQSASGSGRSYNSDGVLADNGGGAFGDSKAKSTAIIDGIERLSEINFELLDFNKSRTYEALLAIRDNTEGFVRAVTGKLQASGTNSLFGTKEGTTKPTGVAGSLDKILGIVGLGGLFGETVDRKIQDAGITVTGRLTDIIAGKATQETFETIRDEWTSFLDSGVNEFTQKQDLDPKLAQYVNGIFTGFNDLLLSSAQALGQTADKAKELLDKEAITLKVSNKGLTGAEYAEAIMAEIGIQLDIAAKRAFPNLEALQAEFIILGETTTDFIIRLMNTTKNVGLAFNSLGKEMLAVEGIDNTKLSLSLTAAAGGLSQFVELTKTFGDSFLSDVERLAPEQKALSEQLKSLGIASKVTKDELKNLVVGYKVTNSEEAEHYINLLKVSNAYAEINDKLIAVADAAGLGVTGISDLIKSVNNADAEGTGASVAEMVLYGIQNTMYENAVTAVSQAIVDTVITPIISSMMAGTLAADLMNGAFDSLYGKALNIANGLATAFADPKFQEMIASISNTISTAIITVGRVMPLMPKNPSEIAKEPAADKKVEDLEGDEFKKLSKELEDLKDQGLTPAALLIKQSTALLSDRNRQKFEEIQLEKKLIQTRKDQADFDLKYIDTIEAITQGTTKVNAQYTKLATSFLALDGADKLGMNLQQVYDGFQSLDSSSIYDFIIGLGNITTLSPAVKTGLMGIAQSLLTIKSASEQAKNTLEAKIYTAQGNTESALAITRLAELQALEENLRPRQEYLYALEDEAALKAKLKTAYDKEIGSMKDLITKLKDTSKTIKEYQDTLKMGDLSILTPEQKYLEAKSQAGALAEVLASTDPKVTMDQKIEAANKLPAAAEAVLTASRTLFASSSKYQDDYNTVQSYLSSVTSIIDSIVTPAEAQLSALEASSASLTSIEASSASILEELKGWPAKLEALRIASVVSGSVASGIVDTKVPSTYPMESISLSGAPTATPDFTYTTSVASNQLLSNNKELIQEIQKLRKEVEQLRTDQKEQTGHLIASNYDSSTKGAEIVADATKDAANATIWADKQTVKLK